jgi:hypothetical protein
MPSALPQGAVKNALDRPWAMSSNSAARPKRSAVLTHGLHALDHGLPGRNQPEHFAVEHDITTDRTRTTAEDAQRSQMAFGVADALAQPIALAFSDSCKDGEGHGLC